MEYRRQNQSTWTSVTPQSGKTLGTYFSGGIVADGSLDGAYEVDFPDAAFADGDQIQFTSLPPETADEVLDSKLVYTIQTNGNGFSILKPDGTPIQVTNEVLFGVDGKFGPEIKEVAAASNTTTTITAVTYGGAFFGDFALANADSFDDGDQVKFTNLPAGSPLKEDTVYTLSTLFANSETGAESSEGQPNAIKVYQFNDINGNPVAGVNEISIGANTQVTLLGPTADPANPKTSSISAVAFSAQNFGQFLGEFITGNPPEFTQGQKVSLTNLPEGSKLSTTEVYTISNLAIDPANPNQNLFTLLDADGVSLELSLNDIAANTQIALSAISSEGTFLSFDQRNFEGSFAGYFNNIVTVLAQELNTTNIRLEDQELSEKMAVETRDQYSGVSQDEEVTDMMKFQRSFQASARHINIIDSLLDQVVNRLGIG
jgi:flagellar hook-associated protein FlgK